MRNENLASKLSAAIIAVLNDDRDEATKLVAQALQGLTAATSSTPKAKATEHKPTKTFGRRGPVPALTGDRLADFNARALAGATTATLAKRFQLAKPTAARYARAAKAQHALATLGGEQQTIV